MVEQRRSSMAWLATAQNGAVHRGGTTLIHDVFDYNYKMEETPQIKLPLHWCCIIDRMLRETDVDEVSEITRTAGIEEGRQPQRNNKCKHAMLASPSRTRSRGATKACGNSANSDDALRTSLLAG